VDESAVRLSAARRERPAASWSLVMVVTEELEGGLIKRKSSRNKRLKVIPPQKTLRQSFPSFLDEDIKAW